MKTFLIALATSACVALPVYIFAADEAPAPATKAKAKTDAKKADVKAKAGANAKSKSKGKRKDTAAKAAKSEKAQPFVSAPTKPMPVQAKGIGGSKAAAGASVDKAPLRFNPNSEKAP
jgi:hypothetical protein